MNNEKLEVLKTADSYLDNLIKGIEDISELIQAGKEFEAINKIPQIIDGIDYILKAIILTKDIHKESIDLGSLNEQLEQIIEAFENEDYILIGDLFNYELLPIMENIHEGIRKTLND